MEKSIYDSCLVIARTPSIGTVGINARLSNRYIPRYRSSGPLFPHDMFKLQPPPPPRVPAMLWHALPLRRTRYQSKRHGQRPDARDLLLSFRRSGFSATCSEHVGGGGQKNAENVSAINCATLARAQYVDAVVRRGRFSTASTYHNVTWWSVLSAFSFWPSVERNSFDLIS